MSDQVSDSQAEGSGQAATETAAAPVATQSASELEALKKELAAARREAAKYRTRNDEETAQKLKEQGDYKALYEKEALDRASFSEMRDYLSSQLESINADGMPDYLKTALDAMPSLVGKVKLIQQFQAANTGKPAAPVKQAQSPVGAPPPAPGAPDVFAKVADDPAALRAARERDPEGFMTWARRQMGKSKPQTTWQRMQDQQAAIAKRK
jgi:exonuclease VII large subunit